MTPLVQMYTQSIFYRDLMRNRDFVHKNATDIGGLAPSVQSDTE